MTNNSSGPSAAAAAVRIAVPSVVPPHDTTAVLPELHALMNDIFENGESLPDQVYKDMLDNCARVQRSIGQLVQSEADRLRAADAGLPGSDEYLWRRRHSALFDTYHQVETQLSTLKRLHKVSEEENKRLLRRIEENSVPALPCGPSVCCFKSLQAAFERDPSIKAKTARCGCCHRNYPIGYGGQNFRSESQKNHRETCGHTHKSCCACRGQNRREERLNAFAATFIHA